MTSRQEKFVKYFVEQGQKNATKAARQAGYNKRYASAAAHTNLKKPEIQEAVKAEEDRLAHRNDVSLDYFVINLKGIIDDPKAKPSDRINAIRELGVYTGHRKEDKGNASQPIQVFIAGVPVDSALRTELPDHSIEPPIPEIPDDNNN